MKKVKLLSFVLSIIIFLIGTFNYFYEWFDYESFEIDLIRDIYFLFFSFGENFSWISYYIFPSLKASSVFIIGQILFFPVLWGMIYFILQFILFVNRRKHYNKKNEIEN
jgi:glucan phosphoethanolaminetransferase (alkaline phosphatase superfamily)